MAIEFWFLDFTCLKSLSTVELAILEAFPKLGHDHTGQANYRHWLRKEFERINTSESIAPIP